MFHQSLLLGAYTGCILGRETWHGIRSTENLIFDPPEYFGFVCDPDMSKTKLVVTIVDKNLVCEDTVLGSAVFSLKKKTVGESFEVVEANIIYSETGDRSATSLILGLRLVDKAAGFGFGVEQLFEYERWNVTAQVQGAPVWGSSEAHLLSVSSPVAPATKLNPQCSLEYC